jgi:hypothetical protein
VKYAKTTYIVRQADIALTIEAEQGVALIAFQDIYTSDFNE